MTTQCRISPITITQSGFHLTFVSPVDKVSMLEAAASDPASGSGIGCDRLLDEQGCEMEKRRTHGFLQLII